jgi:serine/threonine-protein kinase
MSPEQVQGQSDIDERTDIYSLGCVLFECLAGRPPFTAEREELVLRMHLDHAAPSVTEYRTDVPPVMEQLLAKALASDRADRWPSATAMREALAPLRDELFPPG